MSLILLAAVLLTILEAATLWLLGVFDRPRFDWYDSFLAKLLEEDEEEEEDGSNRDQQRDDCGGKTAQPAAVDQIYVLVALSKLKHHLSTNLVCSMLSRTRGVLEATLRHSASATASAKAARKQPISAALHNFLAEGTETYGTPPDTESVVVSLSFMEERSPEDESTWWNRICRRGQTSHPVQKEWGFGWLLGSTTTLTELQAMLATASKASFASDFIPLCEHDVDSLAFEIAAYSIQVSGPVVKGRIGWRSTCSALVARWLHWRRVQAVYDQQPLLLPHPSIARASCAAMDQRCFSSSTVRCEIYMVGADRVPECVDYILLDGHRVRRVYSVETEIRNNKIKIS